MLNIGLLRKRITLQRRSTSQDAFGAQVETWTDLGQAWAEIVAVSSRQKFIAQSLHVEDTHQITMRHFPGLTASDRVTYVDDQAVTNIFDLTGVDDVEERHRLMVCTAVLGMAPG